ncbi:O-antigen ligase family protein [bacterium]|nr:O-antigen ligase family protein [bacterium]
METYNHTITRKNSGFNAFRLSYILFGAFILTASMNRISIYQNFTVPDLFLSLSFLIIVTGFLIKGFFPVNLFIHDNPVLVPGFLFVFSCLLAILFGPKFDFLNSILVLAQFIFIFFVMAPLFRFNFHQAPEKAIPYAETIGALILISGLFACLVAILREYTGVIILNAAVTRMGRHASYMGQPGNFSQYLTLVWPFGLYFASVGTSTKKFLGIIGVLVLVWGVFLTASRFAFIAIPLISCFYLGGCVFYTKERQKKFLYGFVITLVFSVIAFGIYVFIKNPSSLESLINSISITNAMEKKLFKFYTVLRTGSLVSFDPKRVFVASRALDLLRSFPILGIGLDNARYIMGFRVHISLFTVWIEGGMLALISMIIIYWLVLKSGIRVLRSCKNYRDVSLVSAFLASCAGGFLIGFRTPLGFQNRYYWIPYFVVLFLAIFTKSPRTHNPDI